MELESLGKKFEWLGLERKGFVRLLLEEKLALRRQQELVVVNQIELESLGKKLEVLGLERKEFLRLLLE